MTECAPVVVFLYNRPEYSAELIRRVEAAKPSRLYLVFDAPSPALGDVEFAKCTQVLRDWKGLSDHLLIRMDLDISREHLGCRDRVSSGLDWVFERETEAIILEDDLLPNASFFQFCTNALERFRNDDGMMAVNGCNFRWPAEFHDPYFSRYVHVWGWATWRRAWRFYDKRAAAWRALHGPAALDSLLRNRCREIRALWASRLESVASEALDTWDYQWQLAIWLRFGVVVGPPKNLVSNIGTGPIATHTKDSSLFMHLPTEELDDLPDWNRILMADAVDRWFEETLVLPISRANGYK